METSSTDKIEKDEEKSGEEKIEEEENYIESLKKENHLLNNNDLIEGSKATDALFNVKKEKNRSMSDDMLEKCKTLHQKLHYHFGSLPLACQNLLDDSSVPIEESFPYFPEKMMLKRDDFLNHESKGLIPPRYPHRPLLDSFSYDNPINIDPEKGRPLSTKEIYDNHSKARREARIKGALASDPSSKVFRN